MAERIRHKHATYFEKAIAYGTALKRIEAVLKTPQPPLKEGRLLTESKLLNRSLTKILYQENIPTHSSLLTEYNSLIEAVPKPIRKRYVRRLMSLTKGHVDERVKMQNLSGVVFELKRIKEMLARPDVVVDFSIDPFQMEFEGFDEWTRWDHIVNENGENIRKPRQKLTHDLEIDVPLRLKSDPGKPYIYEVKDAQGSKYGSHNPSKRVNQLLKYDAAVATGVASGATVEIKGRIGEEILTWIMSPKNPLPNVEVVYTMLLPSGEEYRFVLKPSSSASLKLESQDGQYKNTQDDKVIRGIKIAMAHKDRALVRKILSHFTQDDFEEDVPFLNAPDKVRNFEDLANYQYEIAAKIWERFQYLADNGVPLSY